MNYRIYGKFLIFVFLWVSLDSARFIYTQMDIQRRQYEKKLTEKQEVINQYEKQEDIYVSTLTDIVVSLYEKEHYMNVGGLEKNDIQEHRIHELVDAIQNNVTNFNELLTYTENFFSERGKYLSKVPSIFPVEYHESVRITSPFGNRIYPLTGKLLRHEGIDISGDHGTKILATADGIVREVWIWHNIYGKMVKIEHANGFVTMYSHLSSTWVREGFKVKQGQTIGIMGNTGRSAGRHLHYQIEKDGIPVDPLDYLNSSQVLF